MNILLTGVTGFLGGKVAGVLKATPDVKLTSVVRRDIGLALPSVIKVADISASTDWGPALSGQHVVIHAAAKAHVLCKDVGLLEKFRSVNVDGTLNLARQAAAAGAKRFIFISSIGVNGDFNETPFTEDSKPSPSDYYAQSKWAAEQGLWDIQHETGIELVVIRPPLIYGPDAPGNFARLSNWVAKGVPLPFGSIYNQRSFVAVDNLVDLIVTCVKHPAAANELFLAGDGHDLSTTELLREVSKAMGKPSRLIAVPSSFLMPVASILGRKALAQKLLGSLQVDITKARQILEWEPPISVEEGLKRCFK